MDGGEQCSMHCGAGGGGVRGGRGGQEGDGGEALDAWAVVKGVVFRVEAKAAKRSCVAVGVVRGLGGRHRVAATVDGMGAKGE